MNQLDQLIADFSSLAWGYPLLILLIGGGTYLLLRIKAQPFKYFGHALALIRGNYKDQDAEGEISHFEALSTALASTIGMGNVCLLYTSPSPRD